MSQDHLLELKASGGNLVIAFVHSSTGSASGFRRLIRHLRTPAHYVAFEAAESAEGDCCSIPAIACGYWSELQAVLNNKPSAKLVLVGWSFGGALAIEITRLAEAAGQRVASVILLDAATPDLLRHHRRERSAAEIASLFGVSLDVIEDPATLDDGALASFVADKLTQEASVSDISPSDVLPYIRLHRWHVEASTAEWRPNRCAAPLFQFRATEETGWADAQDDLGWEQLLNQPVTVLRTPGTHNSLLSQEHAPSLARSIDTICETEADGFPLSSAQSRLWFLWQLDPDGAHYTTQFGWCIPDASTQELEHAWRRLCARHTMLRSSYGSSPTGEPLRFVQPIEQVSVDPVRLGNADPNTHQVAGLASEQFRIPFDLTRESVRAVVVDDGSGSVWLLVTCHHIAVDGWCLELIERDLKGLLRQPDLELPDLRADYQNFVAWEQRVRDSPSFDAQLQYWTDALNDIKVSPPPPDLFEDAESGAGSLRFHFSDETIDELNTSGTAAGITLFAALLTCITVALHEWASGPGVAAGVNLANRPASEFEDVVGLFVDPVPLWLCPASQDSFAEAAKHVRQRLNGAFEHADVPYQDVVAATVPPERDPWSPLFWVIVNMDHIPDDGPEPIWETIPVTVPPDAKFPMAVLLQLSSQGLAVELLYPKDRYRSSTIDRVRDRIEQLIFHASANGFDTDLPPSKRPTSGAERFRKRFSRLNTASSESHDSP